MAKSRAAAAMCAVLAGWLIGGCSTSSSPSPTPPSSVQLVCGTYNAGASIGVTLAVVIDPPRPTDLALAIDGAGVKRSMTCPAGKRLCLAAWPEMSAWPDLVGDGHVVAAAGDVGRGPEAWQCRPSRDSLLSQPEGTAVVEPGQVKASWAPVPGAATYRATFRDLGPPGVAPPRVLGTSTTTGTQASFTLTGAAPALAVVEVEASPAEPAPPSTSALPAEAVNRSMRALPVGTAPWSLKQPSDFAAGSLTLTVPAGGRLAVVLLNVNGADHAVATLRTIGTGVAPHVAEGVANRESALAAGAWRHVPVERVDGQFRAQGTLATPAAAVAAPPATTTFCTRVYDSRVVLVRKVRRPATLMRDTGSALLYVDDANASEFTPADWDSLATYWEGSYALVTGLTAPPSDVDGNGRVTIFFTSAMGPVVGGFCAGDFDALDGTPDCTGTGSNHADMIHVHSLVGMEDAAGTPISAVEAMPLQQSTMTHEFQHLVDMPRFWGDDWLMEGRALLSESLAARGFHVDGNRRIIGQVFQHSGPGGGHADLRLLPWEQEFVNYSASGTFLQYLVDRLGSGFVDGFYREGTTLAQLESTSGLPFPVAFALWTGALVFSNEPASPWPVFDYTGTDWTPLHQKFQRFEYAPLDVGATVTATLRTNGFDVFVTGPAGAGDGSVIVTSGEAVKPYVVAIPFTGTLP